jgi:hypothetical protein
VARRNSPERAIFVLTNDLPSELKNRRQIQRHCQLLRCDPISFPHSERFWSEMGWPLKSASRTAFTSGRELSQGRMRSAPWPSHRTNNDHRLDRPWKRCPTRLCRRLNQTLKQTEPLHGTAQVGVRRLNQQMKMVIQQDIRMNTRTKRSVASDSNCRTPGSARDRSRCGKRLYLSYPQPCDPADDTNFVNGHDVRMMQTGGRRSFSLQPI